VDIGSKPGVIREIPTGIVGILVDDDGIRVPIPVCYIGEIYGGNGPIPVIEPETVRATTSEMPFMAGAEAAVEPAVLPGMVQMKVGVMTFVPHPAPIRGVDVRSVGMSGLIVEFLMFLRWRTMVPWVTLGTVCSGRRAVGRNIAVTDTSGAVLLGMTSAMFVVLPASLHGQQ
jgi:hypothetical protein